MLCLCSPVRMNFASTAVAEGSGALFVTTHWSVVLVAGRTDSTRAQNAMARLCQTYWYPLYAYVRRRAATSTSATSARMCRTSPPQGRATHRSFRSRRRRSHCRRQSCPPHPRQRKPVTVGFCPPLSSPSYSASLARIAYTSGRSERHSCSCSRSVAWASGQRLTGF